MNVFLVLAHPEPTSFNHALAAAARDALAASGHAVRVSDLYREGFSPLASRADFIDKADADFFSVQAEQRAASTRPSGFVPEIAAAQANLQWCDLLILQSPIWWFSVPAVLKGWFDRVLAAGFAYGDGRWFETAPLVGRRALVSMTSGGAEDRWGPDRLFGDPNIILHAVQIGTLNFCGFEVLEPHLVFGPRRMTDQQRADALAAWGDRLSRIEDEPALAFRRAADFGDAAYRDR